MIDRHTYIHKLYVCINWNWDVFHLCVYFCELDLVTILAKRKKSLKKKFMLSNGSPYKKIVFIKQGQFTDTHTHTQLIWFLAFSCFKFSFCFVKFKKPKKSLIVVLVECYSSRYFLQFLYFNNKKKLRQEKKNRLTWYQWISSLSHTHTHTQ